MTTSTRQLATALTAVIGIIALVVGVSAAAGRTTDEPLHRRHSDGFVLDATVNTSPGVLPVRGVSALLRSTPLTARERFHIAELNEGRDVTARLEARAQEGITAGEILEFFARRIADGNDYSRIVTGIDPRAARQASLIDQGYVYRDSSMPLAGSVALVDSTIDVKGLPTRGGSGALSARPAVADAPIVTALRAAGVIIVGHTNVNELGESISPAQPDGYSLIGGQTLDVRDPLHRPPGRGSAGAGAALAADYADFTVTAAPASAAIGPAAMSGVYAASTTYGCPRGGVIPTSVLSMSVGVMGRSPRDVAMLLDTVCGGGTPAADIFAAYDDTTTTGAVATTAQADNDESGAEEVPSASRRRVRPTPEEDKASFDQPLNDGRARKAAAGKTRPSTARLGHDTRPTSMTHRAGNPEGYLLIGWERDDIVRLKLAQQSITVIEPDASLVESLDALKKLDVARARAVMRRHNLDGYLRRHGGAVGSIDELAHVYDSDPTLAPYGCEDICTEPAMSYEEAADIYTRWEHARDEFFRALTAAGADGFYERGFGDSYRFDDGADQVSVPLIGVTQNLAVDTYGALSFTLVGPPGSSSVLAHIAHHIGAARPVL